MNLTGTLLKFTSTITAASFESSDFLPPCSLNLYLPAANSRCVTHAHFALYSKKIFTIEKRAVWAERKVARAKKENVIT